jgi:hypothetical protein
MHNKRNKQVTKKVNLHTEMFFTTSVVPPPSGSSSPTRLTQQARTYNIYKNTKLKLLKSNAAIWYNKTCRERGVNCILIFTHNKIICALVGTFIYKTYTIYSTC